MSCLLPSASDRRSALRSLAGFIIWTIALTPALCDGADLIEIGLVQDQQRYAIEGATVSGIGTDGKILQTTKTAADGSFALDSTSVATFAITCDYCVSLHAKASPSHIFVLQRYRLVMAADPNPQDIENIPTRSLPALESLVPYAFRQGNTVSDRGLARNADGTTLDQIGLYRRSDNAAIADILPRGYASTVSSSAEQFNATSYTTQAPGLNSTTNGNIVAHGTNGFGGVQLSHDAQLQANAGSLAGNVLNGPLSLSVNALEAAAPSGNISATVFQASRSYATQNLATRVELLNSRYDGNPENALMYDAHATSTNQNPLTFGLRGDVGHAESMTMRSGNRQTATAYSHFGLMTGKFHFEAGVASDPQIRYQGRIERVVSPSLTSSIAYDEYPQTLSLFADATPPRARLIQAHFQATDHRRLMTEAMAYQETTAGSASDRVTGFGFSTNYALAPRLMVRAWLLRAQSGPSITGNSAYHAAPTYGLTQYYSTPQAHENAQLFWVTYENAIRVDLLYLQGRPQVSTSIACSERTRLIFGLNTTPRGPGATLDVRFH